MIQAGDQAELIPALLLAAATIPKSAPRGKMMKNTSFKIPPGDTPPLTTARKNRAIATTKRSGIRMPLCNVCPKAAKAVLIEEKGDEEGLLLAPILVKELPTPIRSISMITRQIKLANWKNTEDNVPSGSESGPNSPPGENVE